MTEWSKPDGDKRQCTLCPRDCRLSDGQRGMCFVRQRQGDRIALPYAVETIRSPWRWRTKHMPR